MCEVYGQYIVTSRLRPVFTGKLGGGNQPANHDSGGSSRTLRRQDRIGTKIQIVTVGQDRNVSEAVRSRRPAERGRRPLPPWW